MLFGPGEPIKSCASVDTTKSSVFIGKNSQYKVKKYSMQSTVRFQIEQIMDNNFSTSENQISSQEYKILIPRIAEDHIKK